MVGNRAGARVPCAEGEGRMSEGYKVLPRGTRVGFVHGKRALEGEVRGVELDPNRKPGIGRVTYVVRWHPAFENVRVPASKVHVLEAIPS